MISKRDGFTVGREKILMKRLFRPVALIMSFIAFLATIFPAVSVYANEYPVSEYVVQSGDSLYRIAENLLGDGSYSGII